MQSVWGVSKWKVKSANIATIANGVAFKDGSTGWMPAGFSSSGFTILQTNDGGENWKPVQNITGKGLMILSIAAKPGTNNVVTTGVLESNFYSTNGEDFQKSRLGPVISQDMEVYYPGGGELAGFFGAATQHGVCTSKTGILYECHKANLTTAGRYVSFASEKTWFVSAGVWPGNNTQRLFANYGHEIRRLKDEDKYVAEIVKTSDGGNSWKQLLYDEGKFYFNAISCVDESNCVVVGEGFAKDGSAEPGGRVYWTTDGEKFELNKLFSSGTESFMACQMLSKTEAWIGGTDGRNAIIMHTTDGGKTWIDESNNLRGLAINKFDFVSSTHGYATAFNRLQQSSLLEYGP